MALPTQEDVERFMAGLPTQEPKKKVRPEADTLAIEAAGQLTPGYNFRGKGNPAISRHLGGGTPTVGPAIDQGTRPATRLDFPETTSNFDVSKTAATAQPQALPAIAPASTRFEDQFNAAREALAKYDRQYVSNEPFADGSVKYDPNAGEQRRRQRMGSAERQSLIRDVQNLAGLTQTGASSDTIDANLQQRQQQSASATNLLAEAANTTAGMEYYQQQQAGGQQQRRQRGLNDEQMAALLSMLE